MRRAKVSLFLFTFLNLFLYCFAASVETLLRVNRLEFLDEVEEWNLIMAHYCLVLSCTRKASAEEEAARQGSAYFKGTSFEPVLEYFNI